jgi:hypothetical protein
MTMARIPLVRAADDPKVIGLRPHPAQRELLEVIATNRIVIAACWRRFGKSRAAAAAALHNLLLTPDLNGLVSRGELATP